MQLSCPKLSLTFTLPRKTASIKLARFNQSLLLQIKTLPHFFIFLLNLQTWAPTLGIKRRLPVSSTGMRCYSFHIIKSPFLGFGKETPGFSLLKQGPRTFLRFYSGMIISFTPPTRKVNLKHLAFTHGCITKAITLCSWSPAVIPGKSSSAHGHPDSEQKLGLSLPSFNFSPNLSSKKSARFTFSKKTNFFFIMTSNCHFGDQTPML